MWSADVEEGVWQHSFGRGTGHGLVSDEDRHMRGGHLVNLDTQRAGAVLVQPAALGGSAR